MSSEKRVVVHECGHDYEKVLATMAALHALSRDYKLTALLEDDRDYVAGGFTITRGRRYTWVIEEYTND